MSSLLVTLDTTPIQRLQGYSDSYPLSAQSTALLPPNTTTPTLVTVDKWLGVTFATAGRFERPVAYSASEETTQNCYTYGANPLQTTISALERFWLTKPGWLDRSEIPFGEDCLNLNVYAPRTAVEEARKKGKTLPVMVWVYGGALNTGHAAAIRHDATELVRTSAQNGTPVIVVTGNYRVNIFGFLSHPDLAAVDSEGLCGNYGFYDQLAVFEWVQAHIHHFGGDKENVTAFGESAGAFSISALLARSPSTPSSTTTPLFNRAILQSGSPSTMSFRSPSTPGSDAFYTALLKQFKLSDLATAEERVAGLRNLDAKELSEWSNVNAVLGSAFMWGATLQEGGLWSEEPEKSVREGKWDRSVKEVAMGCMEHEGGLFVRAFGLDNESGYEALVTSPRFTPAEASTLRSLYPVASAPFPSIQTYESPTASLLGDAMFNQPMYSLANSLLSTSPSLPIRIFSFHAPLPQMSTEMNLGVHHGVEIPFVFGTRTFWKKGSNEERVSEECGRRWSAFASGLGGKVPGSGNDGQWPTWSREAPTTLQIGIGAKGESVLNVEKPSEVDAAKMEFWLTKFGKVGL